MKWFKDFLKSEPVEPVDHLKTARKLLCKAIKEQLAPHGFLGSGPDYWIKLDNTFQVINLQSGRYNSQAEFYYFLNLAFTPVSFNEFPADGKNYRRASHHAFQIRILSDEIYLPIEDIKIIERRANRFVEAALKYSCAAEQIAFPHTRAEVHAFYRNRPTVLDKHIMPR